MEILLEKDKFLTGIKMVEKITAQKVIQPVLSNILIETVSNDRILFSATDLTQAISYKLNGSVEKEGSITLKAKTLGDIITRLEEKPIKLTVDEETNKTTITCGKSKFELVGISSSEYPKVFMENQQDDVKKYEIDKNIFSKLIKQTLYTAAQNEISSVLGGICVTIQDNKIEFAGTDGNRLTKSTKKLDGEFEDIQFIVPIKTLNEVLRISSITQDKTIKIEITKNKILFLFNDLKFSSKLIEGNYPKYQQLIPDRYENVVTINREELISSIERVSTMVNERTNIIEMGFSENILEIMSDTPETGSGKDMIEIDYSKDDIMIAFNYKYLLDAVKNMETKEIKMEISTPSAASIITEKLEDEAAERDYLCLIMPVQVRRNEG